MLEGLKEKLAEHKGKALLFGLVGVLGLSICGPLYSYHGTETVRVTVTDKTVKRYEGTDKYIVNADMGDGKVEVFENTDAGLPFHWKYDHWKYDSSNVQAQLQKGKTYDVDVYGWRIPYLSMYRNIVGVEEVEAPVGTNNVESNNSLNPLTMDVLGSDAPETFVEIDGQKFYSAIDGQSVDNYVEKNK